MDIHLICDAEIPQEVLLLMPNPPACQHSPSANLCRAIVLIIMLIIARALLFSKPAKQARDNVPCELYKMFSDCCPQCIRLLQGRKPVAGIKNIVTDGFGVRGQVDFIDFQSMPNGEFKILLNYIDHGFKNLTSVPLVAKRASSVAMALFWQQVLQE
jgi:hypothetical protein